MLLIAKYSETLILRTTQYWDGLRTVLDPGGRVIRWSLLFFLVLECLVECGIKKTLKLAVEYVVE